MDRLSEDKIIYANLGSEYTFKCKCSHILRSVYKKKIYDSNFAPYYCNDVTIIEIYDSCKNIIKEPVIISGYKYLLEIGSVIEFKNFNRYKSLKKNEKLRKDIYYKTFLGAYLTNNKINNIRYYVSDNGEIYSFKNDIVTFASSDILKLKKSSDFIMHFFKKNENIKYLYKLNEHINITYYSYNKLYKYRYYIYNNKIYIKRILKKTKNNTDVYEQTMICDKELKILQLLERDKEKIIYEETRNNNGKIIYIKKYNHIINELVETTYSPYNIYPLIESDKIFYKDLLTFYHTIDVKNDLDESISLKNKELYSAQKTLLDEIKKNNI